MDRRVYTDREANIDEIALKVGELVKRKSQLDNYEYELNKAAMNAGDNFDRAKFRELYIAPINKEIRSLLQKVLE